MNTITKKILVSLVITIILYLALTAINGGNFVPASAENFMSLVILFIGIYVSTVGTYSSTSKSSSSKKSGKSASKASDDSEEGSVKWFNVKKGYGFITRDQGDDVFVHYRNLEGKGRRSIAEGQRVSFIVVDGDKGLQAEEVEVI
ncbi:MAG: cold shock domain-containing protein [Pseudomonadales bacterium]|nr:cold shock domain-containing protein [Pseudomonadales bacterium]MDG1441824.1 cold shock domain-containing protein [Pseudomonadales bacterium]